MSVSLVVKLHYAGSIMTRRGSAHLTEGDVNTSSRRRTWWSERSKKTRELLAEDASLFLHQSLSSPCLDVLTSCEGSLLTDEDGDTFLDFHGNSVHQVGHANQYVLDAVRRQLDTLPFSPRRYTNRPAIKLAKKLVDLAPSRLGKVLFAPAGTLAVGMALKLARKITGRFKTLSMWDSFHGASLDAISVGGEALFRAGIGPLLPGTEHVPPADPDHCLFNPECNCAACDMRCAKYLEYVLEKEGDIGCVIAEPIRCTTVNPPPEGYWALVRKACDRHGALLVFDETAVCLGRTGAMFAFENYDVEPDIVILGKGLGGGVFPLAAIIAREDFDKAGDIALGHYTHEKNPVACAAGFAAIEYIEEHGLVERSLKLGKATLSELEKIRSRHTVIKNARGVGLAMGLEIQSVGTFCAEELADRILYDCLRNGLSFKVSGGNVLTLTPPLTVTDDEMKRALSILENAISQIEENFK